MKQSKNRRGTEDRRESVDERSEQFIKYFIPKDDEKRSGKDRRKSDTGTPDKEDVKPS